MNLQKAIEDKYGSIDKMLEQTETDISRSYLYEIISGKKTNITLKVAEELKRLLDLPTLEDVQKLIKQDD